MGIAAFELEGRRFGKLVAIKWLRKNGDRVWKTRCDCGASRLVSTSLLMSGLCNACSVCSEHSRREKHVIHGGARREKKHPLYSTWSGMKQRCNDPNHKEYKRYQLRGITVCERWSSFANFVEDVGSKPSSKHTLERIDNDRGYEPGNVRWATMTEQGRNMRSNHIIEFRGRSKCLQDWANELKVEQSLLRYRLKHWGVERAFTTPVRKQRKR